MNRPSKRPGFLGMLVPKRVPGSKVYRAFPELDPFSDEQCEDFLRRATATRLRWLARWAVCLLASAAVAVGTVSAIVMLASVTPSLKSIENSFSSVVVGFAAVLFMCAPPVFAGILLRDLLLRRRIGQVMAASGSCGECGYKILGLATDAELRVTCPECGHLTVVDPAVIALINGQGIDLQRAPKLASANNERALLKIVLWTIGSIVTVLLCVAMTILIAWHAAKSNYHALLAFGQAQRASVLSVNGSASSPMTPAERSAGLVDRAILRYGELAGPVLAAAGRPVRSAKNAAADDLPILMMVIAEPESEITKYFGSAAGKAWLTDLTNSLADRLSSGAFLETLRPFASRNSDGYDIQPLTPDDDRVASVRERLNLLFDVTALLTRRAQLLNDGTLALRSLAARIDLERLRAAEPVFSPSMNARRERDLIYDLGYFASVATTGADLDALAALLDRFEADADAKRAVELSALGLVESFTWNAPPDPYNGSLIDWLEGVVKTGSIYGENGDESSVREMVTAWRKQTLAWLAEPMATRSAPATLTVPSRYAGFEATAALTQGWVKVIDERPLLLSPVRVCIALRRFELRTGSAPTKLSELIPIELPMLPPLSQPFTRYVYQRIDPKTDPYARSFLLALGAPANGGAQPVTATPTGLINPSSAFLLCTQILGGKEEINRPSTQPRTAVAGGGTASSSPTEPPSPADGSNLPVPADESQRLDPK